MAQKHEMEILVLPSGEVKILVKGVPGPSCEEVSRRVEEALGTVKDRQRTTEYYMVEEPVLEEVKLKQ